MLGMFSVLSSHTFLSLATSCSLMYAVLRCSVVSDSLQLRGLPGSSVHGIFRQENAVSSSRGASQPRDRTLICCISGNIHWQVDSLPLNHLGGCHTPLTIVFFLLSNVLGPLSSLVWAFLTSSTPRAFPRNSHSLDLPGLQSCQPEH